MADRARSILIKFLGDSSKLKSATDDAGKNAQTFGQKISALKTNFGEAEGFSGKLKVATSGLGDMFKSAATNPVLLAGGIAAAGAAAFKGVGDFEKLGIQVNDLKTVTGLSADEASRWIEVAQDHGVAADAVESAMGRMNKTVGNSPQVFAQYGVEIAHAKDGTVDANGTFLNAVDTLGKIKDPAAQAAAGAAIFGKGWQGMADLISAGAPQLRTDLASVQPEKIFTENDIKSSLKLRDAFDTISDAADGLFLTVGKALAPVISELAPMFAGLLKAVGPLAEAIGSTLAQALKAVEPLIKAITVSIGPLFQALGGVVGIVGDVFEGFTTFTGGIKSSETALSKATDTIRKYGQNQQGLQAAIRDTGISHEEASKIASKYAGNIYEQIIAVQQWAEDQKAAAGETRAATAETDRLTAAAKAEQLAMAASAKEQEAATRSTENLKEAYDLQNTATETGIKDLEDHAKAIQEDIDKQKALNDAMRSAADATFDVDDKTVAFTETLAGLDQALKDAGDDTDKQKVAYDDVKKSAADLADAHVHLAEETAKASGQTLTATQKQDTWNQSLLSSARNATPAARQAILDYIASANQIPASKVTDIKAAADAGDWDTVNKLINDTSRARTTTVTADLDEASLNRVDSQIRQTFAKGYVAGVSVVAGARTGAHAAGGTVRSWEDQQIVGENGPELVDLPAGSRVHTATETSTMLSGGGGGVVVNIYGDITDGVQEKLDGFARQVVAQIRAGKR